MKRFALAVGTVFSRSRASKLLERSASFDIDMFFSRSCSNTASCVAIALSTLSFAIFIRKSDLKVAGRSRPDFRTAMKSPFSTTMRKPKTRSIAPDSGSRKAGSRSKEKHNAE